MAHSWPPWARRLRAPDSDHILVIHGGSREALRSSFAYGGLDCTPFVHTYLALKGVPIDFFKILPWECHITGASFAIVGSRTPGPRL